MVDDEETLCEVLRFNLEEEGYDVDTAYSAEEALALELSDYSLILRKGNRHLACLLFSARPRTRRRI